MPRITRENMGNALKGIVAEKAKMPVEGVPKPTPTPEAPIGLTISSEDYPELAEVGPGDEIRITATIDTVEGNMVSFTPTEVLPMKGEEPIKGLPLTGGEKVERVGKRLSEMAG